tara:strand:+ start:65 stop:526 length:462 start_codon:yes stop_codon:yes gene_type:complete
MNKKESIALGLFLVSFFLVGFVLFSGVNKDITIKLENGKTINSVVPINFSLPVTIFLMVLAGIASTSFFYYITDLSKKISLTKQQRLNVNLLEGDVKKLYLFVLEKGECLQKDLVYELGLPKAKVTRILHKLDEKGLLKRISYGKTNKIVAEW